MAYSFVETVGVIEGVLAYMQSTPNKTTLTARNFDVTPHLARLQGKLTAITALNAEQEQLKVALANKTATLTDATKDAYTDASGLIDAMMGLLGKGSPDARNLQALRGRTRSAAAPTPPAEAPKP
jgi:hypothetical protein